MSKPLDRFTSTCLATIGTALLLTLASPNGALAQNTARTSAAAGVQAEALLIAATGQDEIVAALQAQGFTVTEIASTLLGRIRVEATSELGVREIIIHRRTGEILRDVLFPGQAAVAASARSNARITGSDTAGGTNTTTDTSVNVGGGVSIGGGSVSVGGSSSTSGSISLGN